MTLILIRYILLFYLKNILMNTNVPNWTDVLQAIVASIAVLATLITLYILVKKDKKRESEIKSLSTIAQQLTAMQAETEKRYKASKKPFINVKIDVLDGNRIHLDFINSNSNTSIVNYEIENKSILEKEVFIKNSIISDSSGNQKFWIILENRIESIKDIKLSINYITEEGYIFIQDIVVVLLGNNYHVTPLAIVAKEHSISQ